MVSEDRKSNFAGNTIFSDEKALIEGLKSGSEPCYNRLYKLWVSRLYRFVYGYVKSESITDDIVQETFLRIWTHRSELNPELSFKSYLFTISYHLLLKELRRQVQNPLVGEYISYVTQLHTSDEITERAVEFDQFEEALQRAKMKLTPRQREIFELNKEQSLSISNIAEKFSITEQVVRNQLSAALKVIRKELTDFSFIFLLFMFYNR